MSALSSHIYPPLLRPLLQAGLQAGAFGALWGGAPADPRLGLCVPAPTPAALQAALDLLGTTQATLLIPPALAHLAPELLRQAAQAGHEIAGTGSPDHLAWLEAAAGRQVRLWQVTPADLSPAFLGRLAALDLRPLPMPLPVAEALRPGGIVTISVDELPNLLPDLLPSLRARGYQPGPVRDLPGLRRATPRDLLHGLYLHWVEDRYALSEGLIETSDRYDAFLRVAALDHAPAPLPLPPHTPTAELHVHSERMVGLAAGGLMKTYKMYLRGLKDVAHALQTDPRLADAQAVFAVSLFYGPLEKAGFTVLDLPPLRARWYGLGFRVLRLAYGTTQTSSAQEPKMAWMPREEFLRRFGSK